MKNWDLKTLFTLEQKFKILRSTCLSLPSYPCISFLLSIHLFFLQGQQRTKAVAAVPRSLGLKEAGLEGHDASLPFAQFETENPSSSFSSFFPGFMGRSRRWSCLSPKNGHFRPCQISHCMEAIKFDTIVCGCK